MEGSQNEKKLGAADLTRRHLADKFLYRALVLPISVPYFNFLASFISVGYMEGSQNKKKMGLLIFPDAA